MWASKRSRMLASDKRTSRKREMHMEQETVLLVTSDSCGWAAARRSLAAHPAVTIVGETACASEACQLAVALQPGVIITAGRIEHRVSALTFLRDVRPKLPPETRLVVIAERFDPRDLEGFAEIGIAAHLLWRDLHTGTLGELVTTILTPGIVVASRDVANAFVAGRRPAASQQQLDGTITERDRAVLAGLAQNLTHDEIASRTSVSTRTVERRVESLKTKLSAPSTFMLGKRAGELGLLDDARCRNPDRERVGKSPAKCRKSRYS